MTLQTVAHYIFPASMRDVGTGVYHLAKGDATEEQCQKLVAGAIRVSAAALTAIALIASSALLPFPLSLGVIIISLPLSIMDRETAALLNGTLGISMGLARYVSGVSAIAQDVFSGVSDMVFGALEIGLSWIETRTPRDIQWGSNGGLLAEHIDNLAADWGSRLHLSLARTCRQLR